MYKILPKTIDLNARFQGIKSTESIMGFIRLSFVLRSITLYAKLNFNILKLGQKKDY